LARLYLHCVICSRKQADGLLSGAAWGKLEVPRTVDHPAVHGSLARACPTCMGRHGNWQQIALTSLGIATAGFAR
jgi:hypothetical protein